MSLDPDAAGFPRPAGRRCSAGTPTKTTVARFRAMIERCPRGRHPAATSRRSRPTTSSPKRSGTCWPCRATCAPIRIPGRPAWRRSSPDVYRVTVRLAGRRGDKRITFTLRLMETLEQSWLVFNPLLSRFMGGEDYQHRPVRISDSGRIRNELQTLCSEALEFPQQDHIRVHFDRIPARGDPSRARRSSCWRSCAGTRSTTRSGSPGSTSRLRKQSEIPVFKAFAFGGRTSLLPGILRRPAVQAAV